MEVVEKRLGARPSPTDEGEIRFVSGFLHLLNFPEGTDFNVSAAMEKWRGMLEIVRNAPLLHLEMLIDEYTRMLRSKYFRRLAESPDFQVFVQRLDDALAVRVAGRAMAENARRRANAHYDNDRVLLALAEHRRARLAAFSFEALEICLDSLLCSAELMISVGLPYAGKYYAMAAAWTSSRASKPEAEFYQPEALLMAARADLLLGNWAGALAFSTLGAMSLVHCVPDTDELAVQSVTERVGVNLQLIRSVAKVVDSELARRVDFVLLSLYGDPEETPEAPTAAPFDFSETMTLDDVVAGLEGEMWGEPFADLSTERTYTWQANGITWSVRWTNEPSANAAAEELLASMQVLALHISKHDACIAPVAISLEVTVGDVPAPSVVRLSNADRDLQVVLPQTFGSDELLVQDPAIVLGLAVQLASFASLLPELGYAEFVRGLGVEREILSDAFIALSYRDLYKEMTDGNHSLSPAELSFEMPSELKSLGKSKDAHPDLAWMQSELEGFDEAQSRVRIERRYEIIPARLSHTIGRLQASPEFAEIASSLRDEGWKDWHLLLSIQSIAAKFWLTQSGPNEDQGQPDTETMTSQIEAGLKTGRWDKEIPIPASEFTADRLRIELSDVGFKSELLSVGLVPWSHIDPSVLGEFLGRRMKFWDLDIPHDQVFPFESIEQ